jgi:hypothetical protein
MQVLDQDFQANKPQAYEEMVPETKAEPEEVEMARKLIESSAAKKFDLAATVDHANAVVLLSEKMKLPFINGWSRSIRPGV